jgi:hypothetical protein
VQGACNAITNSPVNYAAGAGGAGQGVQGAAGGPSSTAGSAGGGVVNTGGGSGGSGGGSGGSGIVIVRAPGSANLEQAPGTNTVTTLPAPAGGCKVATFTVSGTLTT